MATEHWYRWHHGTVTDPKWRTVASRASKAMSRTVTIGHVVSIWAAMMENASQSPVRGELWNWSHEDIGAALDIPEDEVEQIFIAMQGKTVEGERLTSWNRRQPKAEDRTAADRKRAQRERDRAHDVTAENLESRSVTVSHDRGEESRGEENKSVAPTSSAPALVLVSAEPQSVGKQTSKRGMRLPADWRPSSEDVEWARQARPDIDLRAEVDTFRDYWHAKAGADAVKLDWPATWRNWVRRSSPPRGPNGSRPAEPQRHRQELRR